MAAKSRAEKAKILEDTLRKMPDFNAVIVAADAGAIGGSGASVNTAMTSDFQTESEGDGTNIGTARALLRYTT